MTTEQTAVELELVPETDLYQSSKVDQFLENVEKNHLSLVFDLTTKKGRDECASAAYKISKIKTKIDDAGKVIVDRLKEQPKLIDAERKKIRERLDTLRDTIREPLTRWEEEENKRAEEIRARVASMSPDPYNPPNSLAEFDEKIQAVAGFVVDNSLGEFELKALVTKTKALEYYTAERAKFEKVEREAAELARLQREKEESERVEREKQAEREKADREIREAKEAAERELREARENAEKEKAESARREAVALEASERRERELKERAERAEQQAAQAAQAERERIESERVRKEKERREEERRAQMEAERRAREALEEADRLDRERLAEEKKKESEARLIETAKKEIFEDLQNVKPFDRLSVSQAIVEGKIRNVNVVLY